MPFDISSTTPAAPVGRSLVTWLSDASANISGSVPTPPGLAVEPAHEVLAGPTTGADALPAFRLLVAGDIPAIPESGVTSLVSDLALKAPLASPALTGTPTAPTPSTPDNSTKLATTAYVQAQGYGSGSGSVTSVALTVPSRQSVAGSPVTGAGTLAVTDNTQSANQVFGGPTSGGAATPTFRALVASDIPAIAESGVTSLVSDLALKAPLASPTFTGTPAAPTPSTADNSTKIATTAYVQAQSYAPLVQPVMLPVSLVGMPGAGATVFLFTAPVAISFAGNFAGSYGSVGVNPTSTATYTVKKNTSTTIGTLVISTGGVVTFTTTGGTTQSLAAGDRLTVIAPSSQDATLSDAAITIYGTR